MTASSPSLNVSSASRERLCFMVLGLGLGFYCAAGSAGTFSPAILIITIHYFGFSIASLPSFKRLLSIGLGEESIRHKVTFFSKSLVKVQVVTCGWFGLRVWGRVLPFFWLKMCPFPVPVLSSAAVSSALCGL